jgi:hypothetical protein
MAGARHYNLDEVMLIVAGVFVDGFIEGDAITVARNADRWGLKDSHHGNSMFFKNPANSGTATIKVAQGSPANVALQAILDTDDASGLGVGPFEVRDLNGTSYAIGERSRLVKDPDMKFATEAGEVEYMVLIAGLKINHGQNRLA